ncbi:MAG: DUF438 domain-containing protein [Candidatus Bathyarchaeota archaeon]|nr:MAG: DUF438 domain-containing protein [Candidatus Bathyarchaeota archaeon]
MEGKLGAIKAVSKEELKTLLRELRSEAGITRVREKAQEFLEDVDPKVLSLAEQELIQEGMNPEEIKKLCELHLKVLLTKDEKSKIEPTHQISILRE